MFLDADKRQLQAAQEKYPERDLGTLSEDEIKALGACRSGVIDTCILLPTRELAVQVKQVIKIILGNCGEKEIYRFRTCLVSGGFAVEKQERELKKVPEILISTVGRLWDLIQAAQHESLETLSRSHFLILDEIDRILELGQYKQLELVLKYIDNP